jgi:hypothetical protein
MGGLERVREETIKTVPRDWNCASSSRASAEQV